MAEPREPPGVAGLPRRLLRLEGAALLALALVLYPRVSDSWWLFAALVLLPDLSFLGYLAGPRVGAWVYNAAHVTLGPIALAIAGLLLPAIQLVAVALIWLAHIGGDRLLGYGLKYEAGFGFTHLGRIGRQASPRP
ncbi:MAG: DUF4260 domain-containing protein [Variibacter sp.]|nr:DUF4260 domain-containing protein [Variibacter sp.]